MQQTIKYCEYKIDGTKKRIVKSTHTHSYVTTAVTIIAALVGISF